MVFSKFGVRSFVSETKAEIFVTYLEEGKIMTTRCKKCQRPTFPPNVDCTACGVSEMEWIELKETGELDTFTTVMYGPAGFGKETPYTLAVVRFPNRLRILGLMDKEIPVHEIKTGMELKVVPIKLPEGRFSYQFQKI